MLAYCEHTKTLLACVSFCETIFGLETKGVAAVAFDERMVALGQIGAVVEQVMIEALGRDTPMQLYEARMESSPPMALGQMMRHYRQLLPLLPRSAAARYDRRMEEAMLRLPVPSAAEDCLPGHANNGMMWQYHHAKRLARDAL